MRSVKNTIWVNVSVDVCESFRNVLRSKLWDLILVLINDARGGKVRQLKNEIRFDIGDKRR